MEVKQIYEIYEQLEKITNIDIKKRICKNMKKYRLELYNEYKKQYNGRRKYDNPYSTINISEYLEISDIYYRRLESENDEHKFITMDRLIKLSIILNKSLEDFLVE